MKTYYGNYLGLVINSKDPEYRGRVQIFIPHIMPALYENWNKEGKDIQLTCVGDNIPEGLTSDIVERLTKILPWAEAATPIIGGSSPGNLTPGAIGAAFGGVVGGALFGAPGQATGAVVGQAVGNFLDQSPSTKPVTIPGELGPLYREASKYVGSGNLASKALAGFQTGDSKSACGRGTVAVLGAMTGNSSFKQGSAGGNAGQYSMAGTLSNDVFAKSGIYEPKKHLPTNYKQDASQWQVGDVVACTGPGGSVGHIQTYTGVGSKPWTSDFAQKEPTVGNGYANCSLIRATPQGQAAIKGNLDAIYGKGASQALGNEKTSESALQASSDPLSNSKGAVSETPLEATTGATPTQTGAIAAGGEGISGTISGGGTTSTDARLASQRQRFVDELNDPATKARFYSIIEKEVGGQGEETQAMFIESVMNRSVARNQRIDQGTGFYATETRSSISSTPSQQLSNKYDALVTNIIATGSNKSNYATGNSSGTVGFGWGTGTKQNDGTVTAPGQTASINGERFGIEKQDSKWATNLGVDVQFYVQNPVSGTETIASKTISTPSVVNNTDPGGPYAVRNTNDMAKGFFAYPNPGAMVWVFFREGNPLFPVYFAASFGAAEWSSVYRGASESEDYANNSQKINQSSGFNTPAGGLWCRHSLDLTDPSGIRDQASVMLYGDDGSNMTLAKGQHQIYTRHNRRDKVEQDRFESTMGFKEEWVEGDKNVNVRGNLIVKVGKINQEAMDALQALADKSAEFNKQLTS